MKFRLKISILVLIAIPIISFALASENLISYWRFDDNTGIYALDSSGNAKTATLVNNPTWVLGKNGTAVRLNGVNQYIDSPLYPSFTTFTYSGWFYPATSTHIITLIDNMSFGAGTGGINFRGDRVWIVDVNGNSTSLSLSKPANWENNWHHYVATYDGSVLKAYVDGVLNNSKTVTLYSISSTNPIRVGSGFQGDVDDVRIYARAISADEVAEEYTYVPPDYPLLSAIHITAPVSGTTVSGDVTVTASLTGGGAAKQVQFYLDNQPLGKLDTSSPFQLTWHTISATNGVHELSASSTDEFGTTVSTSSLLVTVSNGIPDIYYPKTNTNEYHVSPSGSSSGTGSAASPWDLATALAQPIGVTAGDTIWLRNGTYTGSYSSTLVGSAASPIIVRQYPGERATIDNPNLGAVSGLIIGGSYTWFWGLEVMCSNTTRALTESGSNPASRRGGGVYLGGNDIKLINMIVHDFGDGISLAQTAQRSEVHGALLYYNGWQGPDRGHGHGIYAQNNSNTQKTISDTVSFYNFATGMKAYGENAHADDFTFDGVTLLNNGSMNSVSGMENLVIGSIVYPLDNITIQNSQFYFDESAGGSYNVMLGYSNLNSTNILFKDNYVVAPVYPIRTYGLISAGITGNSVYMTGGGTTMLWRHNFYTNVWPTSGPSGISIDDNSYYAMHNNIYHTQPTLIFNLPGGGSTIGNQVDFAGWQDAGFDATSNYSVNTAPVDSVQYRSNSYEPRTTVIIWNWSGASSVNISGASAGLSNGDKYEIIDTENYFAGPIASGTFNGGNISVPMFGLSMVAPVGDVPIPPSHTSPKVGVFYVKKTASLSTVTNQPTGVLGDKVRPSLPQNFLGSSTSATSVSLAWDVSTDNTAVTGYRIYRDGVPIGTTATNSYIDTTASAATAYSYRVAAYDSAGNYSGTGGPVTVTTPEAPAPVSYGTSGGGGGGGGGRSSLSVTNSLLTNTASTSTSTPNMTCLSVAYPVFSRNLYFGKIGSDVSNLQNILILEKFLNVEATGHYGNSTQEAVSNFQKKYKIVTTGTPQTTGLGNFGPKTRDFVNNLLKAGKYPSMAKCLSVAPVTTPIITNSSKYVFTRSLQLGSTGADVKALQVFLNSKGFTVSKTGMGSLGNESTYFGPATKSAVIKFQEFYAKDILAPSKLTNGTGYFGPATMRKVNELNK